MHLFIIFGKIGSSRDRYGLLPVGRPVRCGFTCHLITLERAMRHPALAVIAGEAKSVFSTPRSRR